MTTADRVLDEIRDGHVVGLGTGRAATAFIQSLGARVRAGLRVQGVPTSRASAALALQLGIPLTSFDRIDSIDIAVDGADEVDPDLNLIKGWGGALVREKVVAAAATRFVVVIGAEKLVPKLGARGKLPVEIIPFALGYCRRRLDVLGMRPQLRLANDAPLLSDNGNMILDCGVDPIDCPEELDRVLLGIPGVVGTGLFLQMADEVLVQDGDAVRVLQ